MPSFTRPPRVHGGNRQTIKADHHNALCRCIEEIQNALMQPAPKSRRRSGAGEDYPFRVSITKDGEVYYATVSAGYLRVKNPMVTEEDPITDHMPELDGTPLDELVDGMPPRVAIESGETVYCHFGTDTHGIPIATPTIEVSSGEESTHYQSDPDGSDGDYWLEIATVSIVDGVVTIYQHQHGGPIEFVPNLLNYEQVGGGREIIKERVPEEDILKVRTLKEKASDPQVKINENTDYIEIRGNNYDNAITSARKVTMSVKDGLVSALSYDDTEDGINADVAIRDCDGDPGADPPVLGTAIITFTIVEGKITHINGSTDGGTINAMVQSCCWIDDPPEDDWRNP